MTIKQKKVWKRLFGIVIAVLCAPLAPLIIAHYMLTVYFTRDGKKDNNGSKPKRKPSKVKLAISLAYYLVALSSLNIIIAVIQRTGANWKVARHLYAMYVVIAIIATAKMAALMCPSSANSR
jgi:hypothetical protein